MVPLMPSSRLRFTPLPDTAPIAPAPSAPARLAVARPAMPGTQALLPYLEAIEASGWYSNFGPMNQALEARLAARFSDGTRIVTVANATAGLTTVLRALDLPAGSLCAVPSWTFVATTHAVIQAGLVPWFVDVAEDSWMLDPQGLRDQLKLAPGKISAVIPVCAFGQRIDIDAWAAFDADSGIRVVIDAAAAYDIADRADVPVVVSLHATKALGAGEGGFLATTDRELADRFRTLTSFGFHGSRESLVPAGNAKISEYAGAVALAAMDGWTTTRQQYQRVAQSLRILTMSTPDLAFQPGWGLDWISSVCVAHVGHDRSEAVAAALNAAGIETRMWWGQGCHTSRAFAACPSAPLPVTERLAQSTLGLPYHARMDDADLQRLAVALNTALQA